MNSKEPKEIREKFNEIKRKLRIPEKSKKEYYKEYDRYLQWRKEEEERRREEFIKEREEKTEETLAKENKKKSDIFEPLQDDCHTDAIIMGYLDKRALQVVPPSLFKILSI